MFHNCLDVLRNPQGGEICLALSVDGLDWHYAWTAESVRLVRGRLLRARIGHWDEAHETPFAVRVKAGIRLYVLGYHGGSVFSDQASSAIGMVESADPVQFPAMAAPVLRPSVPGDQGGVTSPSVVQTDQGAVLHYTGWSCSMNEPGCASHVKLSLMAVSLDKAGKPAGSPQIVLGDPGVVWAQGGTAEATVIRGPDRRYYLFFSTLPGALVQRIGIGVAPGPFGPFTVAPGPIIEPRGTWDNGGVLTPDVRIEGGRVRLWFHGFETDAAAQIVKARIGYAEHPWPLLP